MHGHKIIMNHLWWSMMVSDDLKHTEDQNSLACPETYWNSLFTGTKCVHIVQMKLVMKTGTEPPNKRLPPSTQCSSIGLAKDWKSLAKSSSLAVSKQVAAIISRSDKSSSTWMAHVGSKLQVLSRAPHCRPAGQATGSVLPGYGPHLRFWYHGHCSSPIIPKQWLRQHETIIINSRVPTSRDSNWEPCMYRSGQTIPLFLTTTAPNKGLVFNANVRARPHDTTHIHTHTADICWHTKTRTVAACLLEMHTN
jgi:hypothetical protein